jgi:hypothetical protein
VVAKRRHEQTTMTTYIKMLIALSYDIRFCRSKLLIKSMDISYIMECEDMIFRIQGERHEGKRKVVVEIRLETDTNNRLE